jgi:2-methylcitrate dehydratase PrpD
METQADAAFTVAKTVVDTSFDRLPASAVEASKNDILDTLGCIIAGSTAAAAEEVVSLVDDWGGKEESTIVAFGGKVPAPWAAFVNGTMGHALDYDDTHDKAVLHVGPAVVSSAMALAQRRGNVDGKTFITSVALGADLIIRLGLATTRPLHESGFMFTPLYGYFGSAAAAAKVLNLDEEGVINAFGITYAQAAGNLQVNIDNEHALTKRLQVGFAAKAGVMAGLLAQKGLTGARQSMEGRFGLFPLYQRGLYNRDVLLSGLGEEFEVSNLSFKPYSCCRQIHGHVDAALQLKRDYNLQPDDIASVRVFVNADPHPLCDPLDLRRRPQEEVHAQFSIPYSVAVALTYGKVLIKDYTLIALKDEDVLRVADRVTPVFDPELPTRIVPPARMEIVTTDGRTLVSEIVTDAKGHPNNPMSFEELSDKFRDCVTHSVKPIDPKNVEKVIEMCADLENVKDVSALVDLLA